MFALRRLIEWLKAPVDVEKYNIGRLTTYVMDAKIDRESGETKGLVKRYEVYLSYIGSVLTFLAAEASVQTSSVWIFLLSVGIDLFFIFLLLRKLILFQTQSQQVRETRSFNIFFLVILVICMTAVLVLLTITGHAHIRF
jgi:hypothetical protein